MTTLSVFDTLNHSNACLHGAKTLSASLAVAHWSNDSDLVHYNETPIHTLSYYTRGGQGSRRVDGSFKHSTLHGLPGTVCLFPKGLSSSWAINQPFSFSHLYFTDAQIKRFAEHEYDIDPRRIVLPDLTFHADRSLSDACANLFSISLDNSSLAFEERIQPVFDALIKTCLNNPGIKIFTGGLSPKQTCLAREIIHAYWDQSLSLKQLADACHLSESHFQRMFKLSVGCSPAEYQMELRIRESKRLLASGLSSQATADRCGFSSASYFNRLFKQQTGETPKRYQQAIQKT